MKRIAAMIALVGLAVSSGGTRAEDLTFKGTRLGVKLPEFQKVFRGFKCNRSTPPLTFETVCIAGQGTYGQLPVDRITASFWKQKLITISIWRYNGNINDANEYYSQWKQQLIAKWGLPSTIDKELNIGATKTVGTYWELAIGTVTLSHGTTLEAGVPKLVTVVGLNSPDSAEYMLESLQSKMGAGDKDM